MFMLAKLPKDQRNMIDISSLRNVMVGARPMSIMIEGDVIKAFGVYVSWAWGMTESTCVGTITLPDTRNVSGSVRYLIANTMAKLVDEDGKRSPGRTL